MLERRTAFRVILISITAIWQPFSATSTARQHEIGRGRISEHAQRSSLAQRITKSLKSRTAHKTHLSQATLGADGSSALMQEPVLEQASASERQQSRAAMMVANDELHEENSRIRTSQRELRRSISELRHQDSELRAQDTNLRIEDAKLRSALALVSASVPTARKKLEEKKIALQGGTSIMALARAVGIILASIILAFFVHHRAAREDAKPRTETDANNLKIFQEEEPKNRSCGWCPCSCCCSLQICLFTFVMLVTAFEIGGLLWQNGVVQPILAQFVMYVYVIGLFVAFLTALAYEFWSVFRDVTKYVLGQLDRAKGVFKMKGPTFGNKPPGDIFGAI